MKRDAETQIILQARWLSPIKTKVRIRLTWYEANRMREPDIIGIAHRHLIECIQRHTRHQVVIPDAQTVDYKEALIFALLGLLRLEGRTNVLRSVTGAPSDSCSGKIWHPQLKLQ